MAEYQIDPVLGNDTNDGSKINPWKTLKPANEKAVAGDVIYLRGGVYSSYIQPANSGTVNAPITYRAVEGETSVLNGYAWPIYLYKGIKYIVIDEITVDGGDRDTSLVEVFAYIDGDHNIIKNCTLTNLRTADSWWKGIYITGSYNKILNCSVSNVGHTIPDQATGIGDGIWAEGHHNLVEGNDIFNCGHNTVLLRGHHNIARGNDWHSHWYRTAEMHSPSGNNAHLVMDGNIIRDSSGMTPGPCPASGVQSDSAGGLFRRNIVIGNRGPGLAIWGMVGAGIPKGFRAIHNTFVGNDVGIESNQISENYAGEYSDIVLGNNIIVGNNNPGIRYKPSATDPADHLDVGNFKAGDPLFVDAANGDFRLQPGSPCLNAGIFLTRTREAGSGTVIPVVDASYFIDGFGIVEGDTIQLQGTDEPLIIVAIDYATNTITVDRPVSWTSGQGVALGRIDTAPNIGAFEYQEETMAIKSVPFTLEVTAAPDFFPAIAPVSLSVAKGVVAVYNITFTAQGGFTGPVSLIAKNLPTGAVGTFDKPSINVGETSRLSITTSGVAVGSYSPSIEGTANL